MIEEIVQKIDQIIQISGSVYVYTESCSCIVKVLTEVRSKIINFTVNSNENELALLLSNLNKLFSCIDTFTPIKWSQNTLQVPIIKPISDLKGLMESITENLQKLKISMSNKYEISTECIANDLKSIYGIFADPARQNDQKVTEKLKEIEQQLDEMNHPLINTSQRNSSKRKNSSRGQHQQNANESKSSQDTSEDALHESSPNANEPQEEEEFSDFNNVQKYKLKKTDYTQEPKALYMNDRYIIYKGQMNSTKEDVTIMELNEENTTEEKFKRFVNVLTAVQHPNLESFVGYVESPKPFVVITRRNGEKLSYILQQAKERMTKKQKSADSQDSTEEEHIELKEGYRTIIAFKVATAMAYLHSLNIIHRDLYSSNIMIDQTFNPRITNFANSRYLPEDLSLLSYRPNSTGNFKAPELFSTDVYNKSADVFTFGGLLYDLLTGSPPFSKLKAKKIEEKILANERPALPPETSDNLKKLITSCWAQDPKDRPSFSNIVDDMLTNEISFPIDDNTEITKQFYASKKIKNNDLNACIQLFRSIEHSISNCYAYMCESIRIRSLLYSYKFLLQTSSYATQDIIEDYDILTQLSNLRHSLENLLKTLNQMDADKWKEIALYFSVTEIPNDLRRFMEEIYIEMTQLGFNVTQYEFFNADLARDFRVAYSYFSKFEEDENNREKASIRMEEIHKFLEERDLDVNITQDEIDEKFKNLFSQFTNYQLNRSDFKLSKTLGNGVSATVKKAVQISTKKQVAIKEFKRDYMEDEDAVLLLRREIAFLVSLHHDYIVSFIGFNNDPGQNLWVVSEFVKNGELANAIKHKKLSQYQKTKIAFEIAEGMEYLHMKNVIHRDLKPGNILLDRDTPKITDFGFSRMNMSLTMTNKIGTAKYMAPEVIKGDTYDFKADVFSYSMILWELYTNGTVSPFPDAKDNSSIMEAIVNKTPLPFCLPISDHLKDLIQRCRSYEPQDRPSFTEIIEFMLDNSVVFNGCSPREREEFYEMKMNKREELIKSLPSPANSTNLSLSTILTFS